MNTNMDNKVLLITGGTGSFGNTVLREFINSNLKEIRIFSRDEEKQDSLRRKINNPIVKFYIGDVRDYESISEAMSGVDFVFHAAALKQVPSCEFFPMQAVRTNVIGTENVIKSAIYHKVKKVICLSTDKAVYPINAMGMSKALMEKLVVANSRNLSNGDTLLCATRYGNVMASRGSVIPLFISQIKSGKPITITDPNMTRFMMTLEDSVSLVLFAFEHGNQGDIFVYKAPASTLEDLANALKELYESDNDVNIIGTRHGEKLYESLVTKEEMVKAEDLGQFYRIPSDSRDLNYDQYFSKGESKISLVEDYNSHNTTRLDLEGTKKLLLNLYMIKKDMNI